MLKAYSDTDFTLLTPIPDLNPSPDDVTVVVVVVVHVTSGILTGQFGQWWSHGQGTHSCFHL